jgi:glycosyltransferase involved in cell wall biosynthesis
MRIIHITNGAETNMLGVERHVLYLAAAQKARGYNIMVITDRLGVFAEACRRHGIPVVVAQGLRSEDSSSVPPGDKAIEGLIAEFKSFKAELIHCHTVPAASKAIVAGNRAGISCVLTLRASGDAETQLRAARRAGMRFTVISPSQIQFERLNKMAVSGIDLCYAPDGTDANALVHSGKTQASPHLSLIFVGRLSVAKAPDVAILAMAELRRRLGQDCPVLNIYGDGHKSKYLREMVAVLDLNGTVHFHGFQFDILGSCETGLLIMPSRAGNAPLVILEAMSRGMPIVASDVGEVTSILPDPRYGRVVRPDSILGFADAIYSLLSEIEDGQFDPNLVIERHRSLYSSEKMAERIEEIYKQALANIVNL